ncbi:IS66 family insertion sequence element accessory protein TnpB [Pseudomonas bubulae]|uniref:IS66 family insertion sequence element accessory protein TnpB n=1 Tax=Pseudomonas bubulae TaxID=2316085 RepID=UPI00399CCBFC
MDSLRDPHRRDLAGHRAHGHARRHCAYLFANRRATRIKVLVHDGFGVWLSARRLT